MAGVQSGVYTFLDVQVAIKGPGGNFDIASSGVSDEAVRIAMKADKNTMVTGANGDGMHSLRASNAAGLSISLLKSATGNAQLNQLYRYQKTSAAYWGQNIVTISNPVTGDAMIFTGGAFAKQTDIGYSSEGGMNVWPFDFIDSDQVLGNGLQATGI